MPVGSPVARAAGAVVHRQAKKGGGIEMLLVHRKRYDDWSLPKGHLNAYESYRAAAIREVEEETGVTGTLGPEIGSVGYQVGRGRKMVRYWLLEADKGEFRANNEADEGRWLSPKKAMRLASYARDANVIATGARLLRKPESSTVHLVRHANAGSRARWDGDDTKRPLSVRGARQARQLTERLLQYPVNEIYSSSYLRCHQTVRALAAHLDLVIHNEPSLYEGAAPEDVVRFLDQMRGASVVLCSHGDIISAFIGMLHAEGVEFEDPVDWHKASTWELDLNKGRVQSGRYIPPPPSS